MVKVFFENNKFYIIFSGDNFYEFVNICKFYYMKFVPEKKAWTAPKKIINSCLNDFRKHEDFTLHPTVQEKLKINPELKRYDTTIKRSLMKYPPIKGISPNENFQLEDIVSGIQRNRYAYYLEMGLGKAQPYYSKIMTPTGYVYMKDVFVGMDICNSYGGISKITNIYPQGKKDIYRITFNDKTFVDCSDNHIWTVRTVCDRLRNKPYRNLSTLQLIESLKKHKKNKYNNYSKWFLPEISPIFFKSQDIKIDPYVLGVLIGNGSLTNRSSFSSNDEEVIQYVNKYCLENNFILRQDTLDKYTYHIQTPRGKPNLLWENLKFYNLAYKKSINKHIPKEYLVNSIDNRIALLQGLMDTDGYINKDGSAIEFSVSCKNLIEDFKFLVESLGGRGTIKQKIPKIKNKKYRLHYIYTFKIPKNIVPFRLTRKKNRINKKSFSPFRTIKKIDYIGKKDCQCISVSSKNQLYITDNCIPTHNTFVMINVINHHWYEKRFNKILIICPSEALYNWKRELLKFNSIDLKEDDIYIAHVKNREPFQKQHKINIMTYRSFLMFSDNAYTAKTGKKSKSYLTASIPLSEWGDERCIVLDESHKIKNPKSRQSKVLNLHKHFFEFRYLLTGTPDARGLEGYYNQIQFLDESIIGKTYVGFLSSIADLGNYFSNYVVNSYRPDDVEKFIESISHISKRRFTKDCINLPELYIKKVYTYFNKKHFELYQSFINAMIKEIKEKEGFLQVKKVRNMFPYLSQSIDNPCLLKNLSEKKIVDANLMKKINKWKFADHSKLESLDSLLKDIIEEQNEKVIIWDYHPLTIDQLSERYKKYKPLFIHGNSYQNNANKTEEKDAIVTEFRKNPKRKLLIASSIVLSTAITITECRYNIYFSRSWDLTHFLQSQKRTHRIGQDKSVIVYVLIMESSLDVALDYNLTNKEKLDKDLFNKQVLSNKEWQAIFNRKSF